jgi:hypothetical protein
MNNNFIFLRHGKTFVDHEIIIADWILTDEGFFDGEIKKNLQFVFFP